MRRPGARFAPAAATAEPIFALTSAPQSGASSGQPVAKRQWNPTPPEYLPETTSPNAGKQTNAPLSRPRSDKERAVASVRHKPADSDDLGARRRPGSAGLSTGKRDETSHALPATNESLGDLSRARKLSLPARPPSSAEDSSTGPASRSAQASRQQLPASSPIVKRQQQLEAHEKQLNKEGRRDPLKSAVVLKSLRVQDVEAEAVRPLIEIAYWSPFVEVRRDAAVALTSLSRNSKLSLRLPVEIRQPDRMNLVHAVQF